MSLSPTPLSRSLAIVPLLAGLALVGCQKETLTTDYGFGGTTDFFYGYSAANSADHDTLPTLWANYGSSGALDVSATGLHLLDDGTLVIGETDWANGKLTLKYLDREGEVLRVRKTDVGSAYSTWAWGSGKSLRLGNSIVISVNGFQALLDLQAGELKWTAEAPGYGFGNSEGIVAVNTPCPGDYSVSLIDPADGSAGLIVEFPDNAGHQMPHVQAASPTLSKSNEAYFATLIRYTTDGSQASSAKTGTYLSVYRAGTEEPVWERRESDEVQYGFGQPVYANGAIVLARSEGLAAFDVENGEELWSSEKDHPTTGSGDDYASVFNVLTYDATSATVYAASHNEIVAFDAATGARRWSSSSGNGQNGLIQIQAVNGGLLAATSSTGTHLFDAATGAEVQRIPNLLGVENYDYAPDIIGDPENSRLYIYDGNAVYSVEAEFPVAGQQPIANTGF